MNMFENQNCDLVFYDLKNKNKKTCFSNETCLFAFVLLYEFFKKCKFVIKTLNMARFAGTLGRSFRGTSAELPVRSGPNRSGSVNLSELMQNPEPRFRQLEPREVSRGRPPEFQGTMRNLNEKSF